jgi:TP901 family phage tail tape measure protein
MPGPAAVLGIDVIANITEAQAALAKVQAQLKATAVTSESSAAKSAAAWTAAGKKMETAGKAMTKFITVPAVAAGAVAVKLAMDFDKSMALIQTQAGASANEVKKLSKEVLDFAASGKTQFSPNDLAQALYSIESAGIHGAKAMDTLKASAKLATIGQSDLASTTKALAAAQKTGVKGSANLKNAIGTLNASVGQGQMHMDDLVSAMGTGFLSTAAQMGLSLKDVGGALAELTKQGMPATQSATRLRMTFSLMAAPTAAAAAALKGIGLQADDLANTMREQGLLPALQMLQDHLDGLSKTAQTQVLSAAFGGGRTSAAILALVNNTGDLDTILKNIKTHSGEVNDSFKKMQKEPSVRLERVWSQMQAVLIDVGNKLIPKLIPLVKRFASVIEGMVNTFLSLPTWAQDFLVGAIVAGPFLRVAGAIVKLTGAVRAAAVAFGLLGSAETAASAAATKGGWAALGTRIGGWMGPAIGAASAAGMLVIWRNQIDDFFHSHGFTLPGQTVPGNAQQPLNDPRGLTGVASGAVSGVSNLFGGSDKAMNSADQSLKDFVGHYLKEFGSLREASKFWTTDTVANFKTVAKASSLPNDALRTLQKIVTGSTNVSMKQIHQLADAMGLSMKQIIGASKNAADKFGNNQQQVQKNAQDTNKNVSDSASKMAKNVGKSYGNMASVAGKGMDVLKKSTNSALKGLGVGKTIDFSTFTLQGTPGAHQRGGLAAKVPGNATGDRHMLTLNGVPISKVESGEGIFVGNRNMMAVAEKMNAQVPRFAKGGQVSGLDFALGPYTIPPITYDPDHAGANSHVHVSAFSIPWLISIGHKLQQMGNSVGEFQPTSQGNPFHFGPITTTAHAHYPTDHYSGHAIDVNSLSGPEDRSWEGAIAKVLSGGKGGAMGAVAKKIARQIIKGPKGALGASAQMSLDQVWNAANDYIAKHQPKVGAVGEKGAPIKGLPASLQKYNRQYPDSGVSGGATMPFNKIAELAEWVGRGRIPGITMAQVTKGESAMAPGAHGVDPGGTQGYGLWQITTGFNDALIKRLGGTGAMLNPIINAEAMASIYGSQGLGAWYGTGSVTSPNAHFTGALKQRGGLVMPPFGGSFRDGGTVPGPIGQPRTIVAHGGEPVGKPEIHIHFAPGTEWLRNFVRVEVDGAVDGQRRLGNQLSRMSRA